MEPSIVIGWLVAVLAVRRAKLAPTKPIDLFSVQMKVDLDLGSLPIPQILEVYYPSVYETRIFTPRRMEDGFFVINRVKFNDMVVYEGSETLLNRNVFYIEPRPGLKVVHISSYYMDKESKLENIEFIKSDNMDAFKENIQKPVTVDLGDLNRLPLTVETRYGDSGKMEVFVSDLFKHFVKIGIIKYKNYLIDAHVYNTTYRSLTYKFDAAGKITLKVLSFLNNGKRTEIDYEVDPAGATEKDIVKQTDRKVYYLAKMG